MGGPTSFYVWLGEGGRGGPKKNRGKDIRRALWLAFYSRPPRMRNGQNLLKKC